MNEDFPTGKKVYLGRKQYLMNLSRSNTAVVNTTLKLCALKTIAIKMFIEPKSLKSVINSVMKEKI